METKIIKSQNLREVPQQNIDTILDALKSYLNHLNQTHLVDLQEFVNIMEPKFFAAGYRNKPVAGEKINILYIHDSGIGDFVLQSGLIREIRRRYPDAYITLAVASHSVSLAEFCPYIDEIISKDSKYNGLSFISGYQWNLNFCSKLLARRYHICFASVHNPITAVLMYMSGAQERISHFYKEGEETFACHCDLPMRYGMKLNQHLLPMYNYGNHIVDAHFSLLEEGLYAPIQNRELEIWYSPFDLTTSTEMIQSARRPLYAVAFGGVIMNKHYPPEKYAQFFKMILTDEPTATFVILGGGQVDADSVKILRQTLGEEIFSKNVLDLTNKTTLRQTAVIAGLCDLYIGNDTGTLHIAAAMKRPALAVFPFPADFPPPSQFDGLRLFRPYKVPAVIVQPAHALDICKRPKNEPYIPFGCRVLAKSHCIAQIPPEVLFHGFKLLKGRIAEKNLNPLYLSG